MEKLIEHIGQEEDIIIVSNKYIKPIRSFLIKCEKLHLRVLMK